MDFALTPAQEDLRRRAAAWVDDVCIPLELEAELPAATPPQAARDRRLVRRRPRRRQPPEEHGGPELSMVEQVIVHEELGRNTNAVWWCGAGAYNVLSLGTPAQIERYLKPSLRGERADAYAVTERDAGSDATGVAGTAERTAGGYRIRAEKWFVTNGDVADYFIVVVNVVDGDQRLPTLFLVDRDAPGIKVLDDPPFTHNYLYGHPTIRFDVEVPATPCWAART